MSQGFVKLDSIIRESCEMDGDGALSTYRQREILANDCVQEIKMDLIPDIRTIEITIPSVPRVPFPEDYLMWNRVGTLEGDRIKVFGVNDKLAIFHKTDNVGNPENNKRYEPDFSSALGVPFAGGYGGIGSGFGIYSYYADTSFAVYGYGNGVRNDGHFNVDQATKSFYFNSELAGKQILLEYITSGLNTNGDTMITTTARLAVKHYIRWQRALNNNTIPAVTKQMYKDEYYNEQRFVMRRGVDMNVIVSVVRDSFKLTPKT